MKDFEIGQRVMVRAVSTLGYDGKQRVVDRNSITPMDAAITGRTIRYLGKYHKSTGGGFDGNYNPAFLGVTGSIDLWCVRFGLLNREHLVQDADVEPGSVMPHIGDTYWKFPRRAPRLTYIASPEEPVVIEPGGVKLITFKEPILLT